MEGLALLIVASGLLLCALSIPLIRRKIAPNGWYGVRVPATLRDEALWYEANAYGGKRLLAAGLIWTLAAAGLALVPGLTLDAYAWIMLIVLAVTLVPAIALTLRFVRRSQSRSGETGRG